MDKRRIIRIMAALAVGVLLAGCSRASDDEATTETTTQPSAETVATYTVTIDGGEMPLLLENNAETAELTHAAQADSLTAQAEHLQELKEIRFNGAIPEAQQVLALQEAFPDAAVLYEQVMVLGNACAGDTSELDLSAMTHEQVAEAAAAMDALPGLTDVYLSAGDGVSTIALEDAAALYAARPDLTYHYTVELFGQTLSTDMETVDYFQVEIGDEGLEEFRKLLPMMHSLTYFRLDWCETSDEAMAQLRDEYADRFKVVWRVFVGKFNILTDSYRFWANGITTEEAQVLKYCTEVKYMDIGHSHDLLNIDFMANMPDLEVCIIADCRNLESIEPIRNCTKMEYLEIYGIDTADLSPLENLTELEHLNISRMRVTDLSPLDNLTKLQRLWATNTNIPQEQVDRFMELHPDCVYFTVGGHPVNYQWRYQNAAKTSMVPRYALLRKQIGYSSLGESRYPNGYLREEITYESTGLSPS